MIILAYLGRFTASSLGTYLNLGKYIGQLGFSLMRGFPAVI